MPTLTRRQQVLVSRQAAKSMPSFEKNEALDQHLRIVQGDCEEQQEDIDIASLSSVKTPFRKDSRINLHIETYTPTGLPDRYESSEEEPSPSPDSESEHNEEDLKHKTPAVYLDETADLSAADDYNAEIAVAVPIFVGRPKLVDITNLAPMHKRRRTERSMPTRSAAKLTSSQLSAFADDKSTVETEQSTEAKVADGRLPRRKESLANLGADAPESWLPDDATVVENDEDHYFPDLELRNPPTYNDYDPYSLAPPKLSPRNSYSKTGRKPGSVARARMNSIPPNGVNNGWKGLGRSLSLSKKQTIQGGNLQNISRAKKRMIPRAANERAETPTIPEFPSGQDID